MIYVVRRMAKRVDWDEYDSYVVIADSKEEALKLCIEEQEYFSEPDVTIEEISLDSVPRIILGSFCAG